MESGHIDASKINILIFSQSDEEDQHTEIQSSEFDDEGVLINWPYGFFSPAP